MSVFCSLLKTVAALVRHVKCSRHSFCTVKQLLKKIHFSCSGSSSFEARDITNHWQDILKILQQAVSLSERVTPVKLVDAWNGKGQASLRVREVKSPDLSREDCERVIVHLLLEGVLREDFHFTPYSTISYVLPGSKARVVQSGAKRIFMNLRTNSCQKKVS